jgi:hypothetical protein
LPEQFSLFAGSSLEPESLRYAEDFVSRAAEKDLIGRIASMPLQPWVFGLSLGSACKFRFRRPADKKWERLLGHVQST